MSSSRKFPIRKAVDVGMWIQQSSKGLRHGDDAGPSVLVIDGFAHQLVDGFIGETSEIGEKLSVPHEKDPHHLG